MFYYIKKYHTSIKFPLSMLPPFVVFYMTHRAAQISQMPGVYESFASMSSPLGVQVREILTSLRSGGRLPSDDIRKMQAPATQASATQPSGEEPFPDWQRPLDMDASANKAPLPDAPYPAPMPDPWAAGAGSSGQPEFGGDTWGSSAEQQPSKQFPQRTSWEEIRARSAAR